MKFHAKSSNTSNLMFNDLGKDVKGVSPQEKNVTLLPGESVYMPDQSGVLYSAWKGDAHRYAAAGLLDVNDTIVLAAPGPVVINHNFGFVPTVTVAVQTGVTPAIINTQAVVGTDYTAVTDEVMNTTTLTFAAAGTFYIRIS